MLGFPITDDLWFQLMPHGAMVYDSSSYIVSSNDAALAILGITKDELVPFTPFDSRWFPIKEDRTSFSAEELPLQQALRTGMRVTGTVVGVFRKDLDTYAWLRVTAHPLVPAGGSEPSHVLVVFEDVTEWKQAVDAVQFDRVLFGQGPVVVMQWRGRPSLLVSISPNFETVYQLAVHPYVTRQEELWVRIHPDDRERLDREWKTLVDEGASGTQAGQFRFLDGGDRWRVVAYRTVLDHGGPGREPSTLAYWIDRTDEAENLSRLAMTLEAARTGTWDWTKEKDLVVVDAQWAHLLGAPLSDFAGLTLSSWRELIHPADQASWDHVSKAVADGDQVAFDADVRLLHRSGRWVWARVRGRVLETNSGGPTRILGTQEDISDVVQAEQERSILSQVVEQSPSAILITDSAGTIEYVNRQFTAMSGYSWNEVQGKNPRVLKSPGTPRETHLNLWETLGAGHPWFGEFQNVKKDGTPYWVQASISPILDAKGQLHRYVGQHIDITARKQVEEASRNQYRFQVLLTQIAARLVNVRGDAVPVLSQILGDLGKHFHADQVFFGFLTGRGPVLNIRSYWCRTGVALPDSFSLVDSPLWHRRILQQEPLFSVELPCPVPWADRPAAALLAVPLEGGYGDPGVLVLESWAPQPWNAEVQISVTVVANTLSAFMRRVVDVQDLKKARREAEQANQAKSDFLAHMSHEIRTPMNGILGLAELALGRNLEFESRSLIEGIRASAETLLSLVNDILDVSKIEAGRLELEETVLSLNEVVYEAVTPLRVMAEKKGLTLGVEWHQALADRRQGDPTRIRQVLTNLIANAIKFTPQGTITVTAEPGDGETEIRFSVRDTGPGVPPDRQEKLFQRYSQTEASTTRNFGGTGLGLAICRQLVERMGGEIGYRDATPPGSEFWFTLRLAPSVEALETRDEAVVEPIRPRDLRVLVVEDNLVNQQVACGLLRRHGVEPTLASQGLEALETLMNGAFDLILMDVQMPILDGLATTRAIRRGEGGERHRSVPIVAMTANAMQGDKEASLEAGMDDYITKPISAAKIATLLEKWDRTLEPLSAEARNRRTFDPEQMRERLQLEEEFVREIVQLFLDDLPQRRKNLIEALAAGRIEEVLRLAHTLKGTAANLVAQGVVEAAQELESAAGKNDLPRLNRLHETVLTEIGLLETVLADFLR